MENSLNSLIAHYSKLKFEISSRKKNAERKQEIRWKATREQWKKENINIPGMEFLKGEPTIEGLTLISCRKFLDMKNSTNFF